MSHNEVLNEYNKSSILLLLLFNSESGKGNYPGKIFEYFASQRSILAFGPNNSDTQNLMKKIRRGHYFTYENKNLKEKILDLFNESDKVNISDDIQEFTRENLTKKLSDLLNEI